MASFFVKFPQHLNQTLKIVLSLNESVNTLKQSGLDISQYFNESAIETLYI